MGNIDILPDKLVRVLQDVATTRVQEG